MLSFLSGKKTYLMAALVFVVAGLKAIQPTVPALQGEWLDAVLKFIQVGGGLALIAAFLRSGVAKAEIK